MAHEFVDYFQILEVHMMAGDEAIRQAYKRLSVKYHPDNGGSERDFFLVQEAFDVLRESGTRNQYFQIWKEHCLTQNHYCDYPFGKSNYDLAFQPVREQAHIYMNHIFRRNYEKAYDMLCNVSTNRIFRKDFVRWQQLIGDVHELLGFDTSVDGIETVEDLSGRHPTRYQAVVFQVRVREYNTLLNRVEVDYFKRILVYESGSWKVYLPDMNIRGIIKKYRRILQLKKKHGARLNLKNLQMQEFYFTRNLSSDSFLHNLEYEFLRYQRYHRTFGVLLVVLDGLDLHREYIDKVVETCTRKTDSFCRYKENGILVLFPETEETGMLKIADKIKDLMKSEGGLDIQIRWVNMEEGCKSPKELLNSLIKEE